MQRRSAIKNITLTIGGAVLLPSWANAWSRESLQKSKRFLTFLQENLLAEIVETIIPKTETPGGKELLIHRFAAKMMADCYDTNAQVVFKNGLTATNDLALKNHSKNFEECDGVQKLAMLQKMKTSENKDEELFLSLIKNLTIQGYLNSEYVMTNLLIHQYIPDKYQGCAPV